MEQKISAEGFTIIFDDAYWRLEKNFDLRSTMNMGYDFEATLGDNTIHYKNSFGSSHNLPGMQLGVRYIDSVLVGYQKNGFWILGLHLKPNDTDKLVFRTLVQWQPSPLEQHRAAALQAAQGLAVLLGIPLKIYGDKKTPNPQMDETKSGVTGPLAPHNRRNIDSNAIAAYVNAHVLPIQADGFVMEEARNGLVLKLSKSTARGKIETPLFNLCEINRKDKVIKLIPPTGLLGAFLAERGRQIPFMTIFNVEYRITHSQAVEQVKTDKGGQMEEITPMYIWGVYLTLKEESLLLLQATYVVSLKLKKAKTSVVGGSKFETNSAEGLKYFHEQLAEENTIENLGQQTQWVAYEIAHTVGKPLVITEVRA